MSMVELNAPAAKPLRIALTAGEPAGIGPDLIIQLVQQPSSVHRIAIADPDVLRERAQQLGLPLQLLPYPGEDNLGQESVPESGTLWCLPIPTPHRVHPGALDQENAAAVLATLGRAADGALSGEFDAIVTAPVHKGVIAQAGYPFTGHTEWFAERAGVSKPVMLLLADTLRVALVTTHLPLREVADAITPARLERCLSILHAYLQDYLGLNDPRILVCGLNPHAGEQGVLGDEEIRVISPVLERLRAAGMRLQGPAPADTAFTPAMLAHCDAVLAMYHDQGLPVLKHAGFGRAVNLTLGLPFVRTSVDHGTALELAGTGRADCGSLMAAEQLAIRIATRRRDPSPGLLNPDRQDSEPPDAQWDTPYLHSESPDGEQPNVAPLNSDLPAATSGL